MILNGVNRYLGTRFSQDDMDEIYCRLGNAIKHELTIKFIESGFDFEVLKDINIYKAFEEIEIKEKENEKNNKN